MHISEIKKSDIPKMSNKALLGAFIQCDRWNNQKVNTKAKWILYELKSRGLNISDEDIETLCKFY